MHQYAALQRLQAMFCMSAASLVNENKTGHGHATMLSMDYCCHHGQNLFSLAVEPGADIIIVFAAIFIFFFTYKIDRLTSGPCEVHVCVTLNNTTIKCSGTSFQHIWDTTTSPPSPAALFTAEVISLSQFLVCSRCSEADRTRSAHFFISGHATSSWSL